MPQLSLAGLAELPSTVSLPSYAPWQVRCGIVHIGVSGFHRSHQASYFDQVLASGSTEWGVCGVGLAPADRQVGEVLREQDHLYTLVTVDRDGATHARVVASIVDYLYGPDNPAGLQARLVSPATRIVSLTLTEGGYGIDSAGVFRPDPLTGSDLEPHALPRSPLGTVVAALQARRGAGVGPFTVLSCDSIAGNGDTARRAVLAFARRKDAGLAAWIDEEVSFPNSMVDRITPDTTEQVCDELFATYGIDDASPVRAESFEQWVLEDRFCAGRPDLARVGVQLVDDVAPYELMKVRLLNASHQVMSYLGLLAGHTHVHEVCQDPGLAGLVRDYLERDALPTLPPVPGVDLPGYIDHLVGRFTSPHLGDTLARQTVDGADRVAKFLVPVIADLLTAGRPVERCALAVAAWSRFLEGATAATVVDRRLGELRLALAAERQRPGAFLDYAPVFGGIGTDRRFRSAFLAAREALTVYGPRRALDLVQQTAAS